jgi:hypothetical protein
MSLPICGLVQDFRLGILSTPFRLVSIFASRSGGHCRRRRHLEPGLVDLRGALRQSPPASSVQTVIHCSVDQYCHNGWSIDHLGLPPVDLSLQSTSDATGPLLVEVIGSYKRETARRGGGTRQGHGAKPPTKTDLLDMAVAAAT